MICAVGPDGKFTAEAPDYAGRWVKDADKDINRELRERGLLLHVEQYLHDYPFCWRAEDDPLIQYPRKSWFIRTTEFKDRMLANNAQINWLPEHIRDGRFGNFLETNVDWALSRERYWGTPLPIWVCSKTGKMEAVGSYDELLAKPGVAGTGGLGGGQGAKPELPDDLRGSQAVHRRGDLRFAVCRRAAACSASPEVIDCWYDSGAMPFAQWGYPHAEPRAVSRSSFPADFISEAIDQTRGWFYSLLAISTMLFGDETNSPARSRFDPTDRIGRDRRCRMPASVQELHRAGPDAAAKTAQKMSKSKRNYREPSRDLRPLRCRCAALVLLRQPAALDLDPLQRTGDQGQHPRVPAAAVERLQLLRDLRQHRRLRSRRLDCRARRGSSTRQTLAGATVTGRSTERSELDRWVLSELNRTVAAVIERMDAYDNFAACGGMNEFVDALSNWYVRRSRDRFWSGDERVAGQAGRLLDAVRVPGDDQQADRAVHAVSGRDDVAESGRRLRRSGRGERPPVRLSRWPIRRRWIDACCPSGCVCCARSPRWAATPAWTPS